LNTVTGSLMSKPSAAQRREAMALLIERHGLTHGEVAKLTGLTIDAVKSWFRSTKPTAPTMSAIELLQIKLDADTPSPPI
jgi:predicted transcriptional regulator